MIFATPGVVGMSALYEPPLSSVAVELEGPPPQMESAASLVLLQAMVAPQTGVTPSAAPLSGAVSQPCCGECVVRLPFSEAESAIWPYGESK